MSAKSASRLRVTILGAGIVGLVCAEELVRRGHRVTVFDPTPGMGASHAAAGMLAAATETWHGETDLLGTGLQSAALWPDLASRLGVHLHRRGTLLVGYDAGDLQASARQAELLDRAGLRAEPLDRLGLRTLEPGLGRVAGGFRICGDHAVDPREVMAALLEASAARSGATLVRTVGPVVEQWHADADADVVLVATGSRLPAPFDHLVRGVRGEVLRVHSEDPPRHVLRGAVHGQPVYLVPRLSGEVVVGATSEEHDSPPVVSVGGVATLLQAARVLFPGLDRATWLEATARDRPGTPDNRPLVGPTHLPGVVLAAGHFRHGVLLAPLTARLVADHLETGSVHEPWDPRRFLTASRHPSPRSS